MQVQLLGKKQKNGPVVNIANPQSKKKVDWTCPSPTDFSNVRLEGRLGKETSLIW